MLHPTLFEQDVRLLGHRWSPRVHELKRFLARSGVRFRWFDPDIEGEAEIERIVAEAGSTSRERSPSAMDAATVAMSRW